jgi:cytochrome b6-f complex iron-sulfur subunit
MSDSSEGFVPACALTRRGFVGSSAVGLLVMGCGAGKKMKTVPVTQEGDIVELEIDKAPDLATPGGMVAIQPKGMKPVLVMRLEDQQFRALSLKCTHLGCTVRWDNEEQQLRCPCHGSRFKDDGSVVKGPAKRALAGYPTQLLGTKLQISVAGS